MINKPHMHFEDTVMFVYGRIQLEFGVPGPHQLDAEVVSCEHASDKSC